MKMHDVSHRESFVILLHRMGKLPCTLQSLTLSAEAKPKPTAKRLKDEITSAQPNQCPILLGPKNSASVAKGRATAMRIGTPPEPLAADRQH